MVSLVEAIAVGGGGGLATVLVQMGRAWLTARTEQRSTDTAADLKREEHRDALMFDLLKAARVEGEALRSEVAALRPLVTRVAHFEEALDHIHALLHAEGPTERKAAERRAQAYLTRMRRLAEAKGTIANEAQRIQSAAALSGAVTLDATREEEK